MNKKINKIVSAAALLLCALLLASTCVFAGSPTDQIINYVISAELNEDATVNLSYHLEWMVLESDGIGPVSWVTVGIPNSHYVSYEALSDNISKLSYSGGSLRIDFDTEYYEGEIISFDFLVVQDYMYRTDSPSEGLTTFSFTPGWFDEIAVDNLTIRWKSDNLDSWSPDCLVKDGFNEWNTSLSPGGTFTVHLTYPTEAFAFDESKGSLPQEEYGDYYDGGYYESYSPGIGDFIAPIISFGFIGALFAIVSALIKKSYKSAANFGATTPKITRTKVTYYPVCQGCGAPRAEGETYCAHCGRNYIKSEEIIKEEEVKPEDREALKFKRNGEYRYSSSPDTYVRVNVINVPVVRSYSSSSSSSSRSSCAHSSCACACVSCACACACAGGGRAGCSVKDFYNTGLKLRQLELIAKGKKS